MKKISILLLASIFTLSSCSSDDNNNDNNNNNPPTGLNIDGQEFTITDAKATDNYRFYYDTHSEFAFSFADGPITVSAEPSSFYGYEPANASFTMSLSMVSLGNTFQNGVYQFDENFDIDPPAISFFDHFTIYVDGNNDNDFFDSADKVLSAVNGTITVSGTAPNYTLAFDVTLSNGDNFEYTYNGGFDYIDNRND